MRFNLLIRLLSGAAAALVLGANAFAQQGNPVPPSFGLLSLVGDQSTVGSYAFVSVTLVDVATMAPIRSVPAREERTTLPVHATNPVHPWDALTPAGKVDALERVLRQAVESGTTAALAE